ncbi:MAG: hypothetical protein ACKO3W_13220, partial [bacterium]
LEIGFLAAALAFLVLLIVCSRAKRRAPALKLALIIVPIACLFTAASMHDVNATIATVEPTYAAFLLAVPQLSLLVGFGGLVWIARRWRVFVADACVACRHALLPRQTTCPECGTSCDSAERSMRTRRQRRVLAFTLLAFLSAIIGFRTIGRLGNATLPWRAKVSFLLNDESDQTIAVGLADGVVVARAAPREAVTEYGPRGGIRALFAARIEEPRQLEIRAPDKPLSVAVLPPEGAIADDAWFAGVERSLESRPPEFARAGMSWARTVSTRLGDRVAHFDLSIGEVYSSVSLQRPAAWWSPVIPFTGLIAAMAIGVLVMLLSRVSSRAVRRALSRPPA